MTISNRRKVTPASKTTNEDSDPIKISPLVFISHDTRDAELAEEFSKLLRSASSGALKSFCSSDKKGITGIPYGEEWYPAIMDKLDEASDVVCLLTKNSVDRPWILYEAGVAKGKLDKKVIGIALGIPLQAAVTGPFAQFQNNNGDKDSLTNLILSLMKKVPSLDPVSEVVEAQVEKFIAKVEEITAHQETQNPNSESDEGNSVTKIFEEVKVMFDALPSRIEKRIDPTYRRRKRGFHPMLMEEILHTGRESRDPLLGFLIMISMFKDDYPWVFEVGLETYRALKSFKTPGQKKRALQSFESAIEILDHPVIREFHDRHDESYFMLKELGHMSRHYLDRFVLISNHEEENVDNKK